MERLTETGLHLEDLETFVEVADAGGVSPAARRLGVAKSIVSRRLFRLESELGLQLLARTTRGAMLTEAGVTFREHAARVCAEIDIARETILPAGELRGRLRLAVPVTFGATHLGPVLAELARRNPLLQVHATFSDGFVDLVGGGFDAAVRVGYLMDSSLIVRRIRPVHGSLVASPEYIRSRGAPETPEEIVNHEALMQGTEPWRFVDGDKTVSVNPRGRFKADNAAALTAAAVAGIGIACLLDFMMEDQLASGALKPIMPRYPLKEAGLYVVRAPGAHPARKVRALIEIMIEYFGEKARRPSGVSR